MKSCFMLTHFIVIFEITKLNGKLHRIQSSQTLVLNIHNQGQIFSKHILNCSISINATICAFLFIAQKEIYFYKLIIQLTISCIVYHFNNGQYNKLYCTKSGRFVLLMFSIKPDLDNIDPELK